MRALPIAAATAALSLLAAAVPAQRQTRIVAGHAGVKLAVDVDAATTDNRCWGADYLNGEIFVTADGLSGSNTAPHDVYVFDAAGTMTRQFTQSPHTDPSRLGWFDLANDGQSLIGASDLGIHVFDVNGNLVNTVVAQNGPQTIAQPITGAAFGVLGNFAGIAYDPTGNGGIGSFWVGDGVGDLIECDLQGNILRQWLNLDAWFIRGLALDSVTGMLWVNATPHRGPLAEVDPNTGRTTGRTILRGSQQFPGGLGTVRDGSFGGALDLVEFTQTDDNFRVQRVHVHPNILGWNEVQLLTDTSPGGVLPVNFDRSFDVFRPGDFLGIVLDSSADPSLSGNIAWLLMNLGGDAETVATTNEPFFPGNPTFPELVVTNPLSSPGGTTGGFLFAPMAVGGQVLVPIPSFLQVSNGYRVRMQVIYAHPQSPFFGLMATNEQLAEGFTADIVVETEGVDSFRGNPEYGFFRIHHLAGSPIVDLTLDFTTSSNPGHATTEFDTDANSMGYRFDGGNSTMAECGNTYRNGCDLATGLLYDGQNAPSPCDAGADTGWQGSNPGNGINDFRTLRFRFAPGQFAHDTFEFDCDTDSGPGVNGGAHAAMVVTIVLQDGTIRSGELMPVPGAPLRARIVF